MVKLYSAKYVTSGEFVTITCIDDSAQKTVKLHENSDRAAVADAISLVAGVEYDAVTYHGAADLTAFYSVTV